MKYLTGYPEPTGKDCGRESGSTTLKQCGWCKYAHGTHRYNYCIEGSCSLQKSYENKIHWDDSCIFLSASKADIDAYINYHEYSIKNAERSIQNYKEYIQVLESIKWKATERPCLPNDRKWAHFNVNDPVAVFFKGKWHFGEVRYGYRHQDGCVSYWLEDIGPQSGAFWGSGMSIPTVLLKSEYDFFKANPKEYKIWCDKAYAKDFNGETLKPAPIN